MIVLGTNSNIMIYLGTQLVCGGEAAPSPTGVVLSNFRVENAQPTRVYFDSASSVSGMTSTGFLVAGRTISGISINGTSTTGHYLTVSTAIGYGEIITIELIGGDGTAVDFPKDYVDNQVEFAGTDYWLTPAGSGSKDGTSLANAFDLTALNSATIGAGDRVNIQKGNYSGGNETLIVDSGTLGNHVIYEGYSTSIGDLDYATYHPVYGDTLSATNMPLFNGTGDCIRLNNKQYITFKNLQFTGYTKAFECQNLTDTAKFIHFDNCAMQNLGSVGIQIDAKSGTYTSFENNRAINCYAETCADTNYWLDGDDGFNYNCKSYDDNTVDAGSTDYMMYVEYGNRVVWRDCHIEKVGDTIHNGHGYSFKSLELTGIPAMGVYDSWMVNCSAKNIENSIDFRHSYVQDNTAIGMTVEGTNQNDTIGIMFRDGCSGNRVTQSKFMNINQAGIVFRDNIEDGSGQTQSNNQVDNCIFDTAVGSFIPWINFGEGNSTTVTGNKFYNNTVIDYDWIYRSYANTTDGGSHEMKGNIFVTFAKRDRDNNTYPIAFTETDNCYYSFGDDTNNPIGSNNNVDVNPSLNATTYVPGATFTNIDMTKITGIDQDYNNNDREATTTMGAVKHASE